MTYTLTICFGVFMAICGQQRKIDFPDWHSCDRERQAQVRHVGNGWAICHPKGAMRP